MCINADAPAPVAADLGMAIGSGTEVAVSTADCVLIRCAPVFDGVISPKLAHFWVARSLNRSAWLWLVTASTPCLRWRLLILAWPSALAPTSLFLPQTHPARPCMLNLQVQAVENLLLCCTHVDKRLGRECVFSW